MEKISFTSINGDTIIKSSGFLTLKTYINISILEVEIHHIRKYEQKEIKEKIYHIDFPKRLMKELVNSPKPKTVHKKQP